MFSHLFVVVSLTECFGFIHPSLEITLSSNLQKDSNYHKALAAYAKVILILTYLQSHQKLQFLEGHLRLAPVDQSHRNSY